MFYKISRSQAICADILEIGRLLLDAPEYIYDKNFPGTLANNCGKIK